MSQHHDPVHPDSDHLTAELIADLEEGLLDAESASHARHHLADCDACRDLQSQVLSVTSTLSSLPEPSMPADVEALLIANFPATTSGNIVPIGSAPSRRSGGGLGRILGVAACAAGVMLVGGFVYSTMSSQTPTPGPEAGNAPAATTTPEDIQLASYSATVSGTAYTHDALDRQATKLMDSAVQTSPTAMSSPAATSTVSPTTSPTETSDSSTPTESTLNTQSIPPQVARWAKVPLITDPAVAQECIQNYLQGTLAPLAIDLGLFNGHPAVIVVLPLQNYTNRAEVWVLDPQCKATIDYAQIPLP